MKKFVLQRIYFTLLLVLLSVVTTAIHFAWGRYQDRWTYLTGWVLMGFMLVLAAFNGRKKLSFLPLFSAAAWLQFHVYAGYFAVVLFVVHVQFHWPSGWFEIGLTALYGLVTVSGIVGIVISRGFAKRMGSRGGEVLFGQIPAIRRRIHDEAEALAVGSVAKTKSPTIADFYARELHGFFARHRNFVAHFFEIRGPLNALQEKLAELERFLVPDEVETLKRLEALVKEKDGLDYQYTLQLLLKLWLFVHIPFTWALLVWSFAHVVLVYGFSGGVGIE